MVVTRATRADIDALATLETLCFPVADRFPRRNWRHLLGTAAANRSALTLVARETGELDLMLGAIGGLMRATSRVVRIYTLAVDPATRGRGIGKLLIHALLARAPKRCDVVSLEVRADNHPAGKLYESLGMRITAVLPRYYLDDADGLRYRGDLAAVRDAAGKIKR